MNGPSAKQIVRSIPIDRISPESIVPTFPANSRPREIIVRTSSVDKLPPKLFVPPINRQSSRSIAPTIPIYTQAPKSIVRTNLSSRLPSTSIIRVIPINRRYTKSIIPTISTSPKTPKLPQTMAVVGSLSSPLPVYFKVSGHSDCFVSWNLLYDLHIYENMG